MNKSPRCLYCSSFAKFNTADANAIFGELCDKYHGDAFRPPVKHGSPRLLL